MYQIQHVQKPILEVIAGILEEPWKKATSYVIQLEDEYWRTDGTTEENIESRLNSMETGMTVSDKSNVCDSDSDGDHLD